MNDGIYHNINKLDYLKIDALSKNRQLSIF